MDSKVIWAFADALPGPPVEFLRTGFTDCALDLEVADDGFEAGREAEGVGSWEGTPGVLGDARTLGRPGALDGTTGFS